MGQQQLLFLVVGTIVVAVAIVTGITSFQSSEKQAKIDMVNVAMIESIGRAITWSETPEMYGGNAGGTYTGFDFSRIGSELNENGGADLLNDGSCFMSYVEDSGSTLIIRWFPDSTCTGAVFKAEISGKEIENVEVERAGKYNNWLKS